MLVKATELHSVFHLRLVELTLYREGISGRQVVSVLDEVAQVTHVELEPSRLPRRAHVHVEQPLWGSLFEHGSESAESVDFLEAFIVDFVELFGQFSAVPRRALESKNKEDLQPLVFPLVTSKSLGKLSILRVMVFEV